MNSLHDLSQFVLAQVSHLLPQEAAQPKTQWADLDLDVFSRLPLDAASLATLAQVETRLRDLPSAPGAQTRAWKLSASSRNPQVLRSAARAIAEMPKAQDAALLHQLGKVGRGQLEAEELPFVSRLHANISMLALPKLSAEERARKMSDSERWIRDIAGYGIGGLCKLLLDGSAEGQGEARAALADIAVQTDTEQARELALRVLAAVQPLEVLEAAAPSTLTGATSEALWQLVDLGLPSSRLVNCLLASAPKLARDESLVVVVSHLAHLILRDEPLLRGSMPRQLVTLCKDLLERRSLRAEFAVVLLFCLDEVASRTGEEAVARGALTQISQTNTAALRGAASVLLAQHGWMSAQDAANLFASNPECAPGLIALNTAIFNAAVNGDDATCERGLQLLVHLATSTPHRLTQEFAQMMLYSALITLAPTDTERDRYDTTTLAIQDVVRGKAALAARVLELCSAPGMLSATQAFIQHSPDLAVSYGHGFLAAIAERDPSNQGAFAALMEVAGNTPAMERAGVARALTAHGGPGVAGLLARLATADNFGEDTALTGLVQLLVRNPGDTEALDAMASLKERGTWFTCNTTVRAMENALPAPTLLAILADFSSEPTWRMTTLPALKPATQKDPSNPRCAQILMQAADAIAVDNVSLHLFWLVEAILALEETLGAQTLTQLMEAHPAFAEQAGRALIIEFSTRKPPQAYHPLIRRLAVWCPDSFDRSLLKTLMKSARM